MSYADKAKKTERYTDQNTGETYSRTSFVDMMFNDKGFLFRKGMNSVKSWGDTIYPKDFTITDRGRIDVLRDLIIKDNQFLVRRCGNFMRPATVEYIAEKIQLSERRCKEFISKLKEHGILKEVCIGGITYFSLNPIYGMKDKRLNLTVFIIFQDELNMYLKPWVIKRFLDEMEGIAPNIKIVR